MPRVSIVLPVWNGERYIKEAVDSIRRQTLSDFELLVVDDGSDDRTPVILSEMAAIDPRLRIIRLPHAGLINALNVGFEQSRAEFVARMDADDIALPTRLEAQVALLERDASLGMVGSAITVVSDDLRVRHIIRYPLDDATIRFALSIGNPFAHPVVMMRKSTFIQAGGYRPEFRHAEDYDLWLRMAEVSRLANLRESLLYYRIHSSQVSVQNAKQQIASVVAARVSATARQNGGREILNHRLQLGPEDLESEPVAHCSVVADSLVAATATAVTQIVMLGEPAEALGLASWAMARVRGARVSRRALARLNLARAAAFWSQRRVHCSIAAGLEACIADPRGTALAGRSIARTVMTAFFHQ